MSRLIEKRVLVALKHAPVVVITQDLQLRLKWITPPVSAWDYRNLLGRTDAGSFGGYSAPFGGEAFQTNLIMPEP